MLKVRRFAVSLFVLVGLVASGCGGASSTSYPAKIGTGKGAVTIPHLPSRIVSLSATGTEDLYAVGAGSQVVAVDSFSNYPPNAPRTNLSGFTPNAEAIAKYHPDLVVISDDMNKIVAQLGALHFPVLVEPPAKDLNAVYAQLDQLAKATGHPDGAKPVIAAMRSQINSIVHSVPPPHKPLTVYHELDQTYYSATSHTFIGQMYTLLGVKSIADGARKGTEYPQLSAEYIVAQNPDLIVLADTVCCGQSRATLAARPGWRNIAAVKNGDVVPVQDSIASEWGPRIVVFLEKIANAVKKLEGRST
jgi:iron complex transport system substrate-binding protein